MTRRMGGFVVEHKYADALAKWLDKQPSLALASSDPAASARGKKLFESPEVLCSTCHTGELLTNNQTVDVGTGGKFQVPSLHGVALHGPFMHDGCAQTLSDRFDAPCGGGDKHGKTSQLSKAQIADLVAYLETL
jgi:mono/diheme cytochrome c family protein